jgi:hypothetical protein
MGRLSEYINGARRGRTVYLDSAPRAAAGSSSDYVKVSGFVEKEVMFDHLLTTDPGFDLNVRKLIRQVLQEARKNLSKDAKNYIENDPRKAARAVKHTVYKQIFGGNLSILQKRKAGAKRDYNPPRTLRVGQRGGNRRVRNSRTKQLDSYFGADRGFVLRFLASGTTTRQTRYGSRGSIRQTNWFGHTAPWHMETAAANVADAINEYVKQQANG